MHSRPNARSTALKLCMLWPHHIQVPQTTEGSQEIWGKSGSPILYSPPGSFLGRYHDGCDTSSTWVGLHLVTPGVTSSLPAISGMVSGKNCFPISQAGLSSKTEAGLWLDAHGPLLAVLAPPAQECKGHLQVSPLKGVHLKGGG